MRHIILFALTLPAMVYKYGFGLDQRVMDASSAGMMAVTTFGLFMLAVIGSPKHGLGRVWLDQIGRAHV